MKPALIFVLASTSSLAIATPPQPNREFTKTMEAVNSEIVREATRLPEGSVNRMNLKAFRAENPTRWIVERALDQDVPCTYVYRPVYAGIELLEMKRDDSQTACGH